MGAAVSLAAVSAAVRGVFGEPSLLERSGFSPADAPAASSRALVAEAWPICSDALLTAAQYGDEEQLLTALDAETPNCVGEHMVTPLHLSAQYDQWNATLALLAAGALMAYDELGRTPLHEAAIEGHVGMTSLLLDAGAYIEFPDNVLRTPLHHAARMGRTSVAELLLDRGANIQAEDGDKRTPLHFSSRADVLLNMSTLLVSRGASLSAEDAIGFRPLHYACYENQRKTADLFLDNGADLYARDAIGWNPLTHAGANGYASLVHALVERVLAPEEYPLPDPAVYEAARQNPDSQVLFLPAWLVAIGAGPLLGCCIVLPCVCVLRRYSMLQRQYFVSGGDAAIEAFVREVFDAVMEKKGWQEQLILEWDQVPAHTLADIHRPRAAH